MFNPEFKLGSSKLYFSLDSRFFLLNFPD